jgi:uncharacterized protein YcbK (DUF882 family)
MPHRVFFPSIACFLVGAGALAAAPAAFERPSHPDVPVVDHADPDALSNLVRVDAAAHGRSGALNVAVVAPMSPLHVTFLHSPAATGDVSYRWTPLFGTVPEAMGGDMLLSAGLHAPTQPGIWRLRLKRGEEEQEVEELTLVTQVPSTQTRNGRLNGYHIGTYPAPAQGRTGLHAPPTGYIEVTPQNRDLPISKHFRLGEFLTKDQFDVWPKYVAIDLRLIDKLELTMQELKLMGVRAERMHIMSGFRTPQYNGPGEGGRALLSRHIYGEAADVWVENGTSRGYIADLNGDGRRDTQDAFVILEAVERVEQRYPELAGGVGVYRENGARGPFVHVDVRGTRSRW